MLATFHASFSFRKKKKKKKKKQLGCKNRKAKNFPENCKNKSKKKKLGHACHLASAPGPAVAPGSFGPSLRPPADSPWGFGRHRGSRKSHFTKNERYISFMSSTCSLQSSIYKLSTCSLHLSYVFSEKSSQNLHRPGAP